MARGRNAVTKTAPRPSAMVASAAQLRLDTDFTRAKKGNAWQKLGWDFYDSIGEYRYTVDWLGAMVGKTRLYAGHMGQGGVLEAKEGPAYEYVEALFGGAGAKAEIMRQLGIHFTVAGEAMILGTARTDAETGETVDSGWYVAASEALTRNEVAKGAIEWRIDGERLPVEAGFATRVWRPHPVRFSQSNSATRAVLGILEQLRTLDLRIMAQLNSRLIGAGIFLISDEMTLPTQTDEGESVIAANTADEVMKLLQTSMAAALSDQGSAASQVPIVITAPTAAIEAAKRITFWSELDEHAKELRDETIRRLALGMDVPPEVLTGVAETNHWAAWASDESAIKAHGEPLAMSITQALTEGLLWPYLQSEGVPDWQDWIIGADTTMMRARPNRASEAIQLWDRGAINSETLRRETGFDDENALSPEEERKWLLWRIAGGSATPEQVAGALEALGVALPTVATSDQGETRESRPAPSLANRPVDGPPDQETSERRKRARDARERNLTASAEEEPLHWAAKMVMYRAMERAGNRIRTRHGKLDGISAGDHYQMTGAAGMSLEALLDDAWTHLPGLCQRLGVKVVSLQAALAAYAGELFETREPISDERLSHYLGEVERA